jgi:hypothetical protein
LNNITFGNARKVAERVNQYGSQLPISKSTDCGCGFARWLWAEANILRQQCLLQFVVCIIQNGM